MYDAVTLACANAVSSGETSAAVPFVCAGPSTLDRLARSVVVVSVSIVTSSSFSGALRLESVEGGVAPLVRSEMVKLAVCTECGIFGVGSSSGSPRALRKCA